MTAKLNSNMETVRQILTDRLGMRKKFLKVSAFSGEQKQCYLHVSADHLNNAVMFDGHFLVVKSSVRNCRYILIAFRIAPG